MAVRKQIFSLISLLSIAVLIASFQTTSVSALSLDSHHHARDLHHHDIVAKKKRSTKQKRCKSRPAPSSASAPAPSKSAAVAAAPAPASSSHPAATHSSTPQAASPPPPPKTTSSPPPKASQSSSGSSQSFASFMPNKALLGWGADPSGINQWLHMDVYYNWGPTPSTQGAAPKFMPMLWGTKNTDTWTSQVLNSPNPPFAVKSFNEPELPGSGSLSPSDAAGVWNQLLLPLVKKGVQVGSPAVTSDSGAKPWLNSFFAACNNGLPNCGARFVDIHYYGQNAQDLISFVEDMHNTYGLPIMVSEFACQSFTGGAPSTQSQVDSFAGTVTAFMQSTDYIIAYAAFGAINDIESTGVAATNSMFNGNSESPNALAEIYYPVLG
ncbi:hypothetical protein Clacol_001576 [Clathrus columnatus]|uniref:Asl1-like glycosyl hydrolase catalytic domain-containing protein n=1 Tax=Clathrus columnatus TaxID=1419009 RepID=A0AAV5A3P7_9AGAM|nr:hypothetical protein Clacol_001576 [Clathrus columnatus]